MRFTLVTNFGNYDAHHDQFASSREAREEGLRAMARCTEIVSSEIFVGHLCLSRHVREHYGENVVSNYYLKDGRMAFQDRLENVEFSQYSIGLSGEGVFWSRFVGAKTELMSLTAANAAVVAGDDWEHPPEMERGDQKSQFYVKIT